MPCPSLRKPDAFPEGVWEIGGRFGVFIGRLAQGGRAWQGRAGRGRGLARATRPWVWKRAGEDACLLTGKMPVPLVEKTPKPWPTGFDYLNLGAPKNLSGGSFSALTPRGPTRAVSFYFLLNLFSVPFSRREIFGRCRSMTKKPITLASTAKACGPSSSHAAAGNTTAATMDARDT